MATGEDGGKVRIENKEQIPDAQVEENADRSEQAAVKIQAVARGRQERKEHQKRMADMQSAHVRDITEVQERTHLHLASQTRSEAGDGSDGLEAAATKIQRSVRGNLARAKLQRRHPIVETAAELGNVAMSIDMQLVLSMVKDDVGEDGTQQNTSFRACLLSDLAIATGTDTERFSVLCIGSASPLLVNMHISPPPNSGGPAPSAREVAEDLLAQALDSSSPLREGILTRHTVSVSVRGDESVAGAAAVSMAAVKIQAMVRGGIVRKEYPRRNVGVLFPDADGVQASPGEVFGSAELEHVQVKVLAARGGGGEFLGVGDSDGEPEKAMDGDGEGEWKDDDGQSALGDETEPDDVDVSSDISLDEANQSVAALIAALESANKTVKESSPWNCKATSAIHLQSQGHSSCCVATEEPAAPSAQGSRSASQVRGPLQQAADAAHRFVGPAKHHDQGVAGIGLEYVGAEGESRRSADGNGAGQGTAEAVPPGAAVEGAHERKARADGAMPSGDLAGAAGKGAPNRLAADLGEGAQGSGRRPALDGGKPSVVREEEAVDAERLEAMVADAIHKVACAASLLHHPARYPPCDSHSDSRMPPAAGGCQARMAEFAAAGADVLHSSLEDALASLSRLPVPEGRELWAREVLRSHCHHCAAATLLSTAHQIPSRGTRAGGDAEQDGGTDGDPGDDVYGAAAWSLLFSWYVDGEERSAVRTFILSLAPSLLFTWWSLGSQLEPPLALGDLEALLLGVYREQMQRPGASCSSMQLDVPSPDIVERFVMASSPAAAASREHSRGGSGRVSHSALSQSALERHTIASGPRGKRGQGGERLMGSASRFAEEVRVDNEPCPVATFWLDSFKQKLVEMPLSSRMLFIDMCVILISSGYRTVLLKRGRARVAMHSRLAGARAAAMSRVKPEACQDHVAGWRAGTAAAAARAAADRASSGEGAAADTGAPMLPELRGWGGDWSALGSDRGTAGSGQSSWAPGAGTSGGHIGGLLQLCPLATLEVCNFGPLLAACPREPPRPGSTNQDQHHRAALEAVDQPDPMRLGRRMRISTVVFMHLSAALRMMIGHTRLASLVRACQGTAGVAECAGDGSDGGSEERREGGGASGSGEGGEIVGQGTSSWQYACVEEEAEVALRLLAARAEADLDERLLLATRATIDSMAHTGALWGSAMAITHEQVLSSLPSPLQVYFGAPLVPTGQGPVDA